MTPDEWAYRVIEECARDETAGIRDDLRYRRSEIAALVAKAVDGEREACARIVDPPEGAVGILKFCRQGLAEAIRARRAEVQK